MLEIKSIFKSTSIFTAGLVLQKIMSFVYFTLLASIFGPEKLGLYVFVFSYIGLFGLLIDFGTNHYITREIARNPSEATKLMGNVFGFKFFAGILAVILAMVMALILGYSSETLTVLGIGFGIMLVESYIITMYAVMRGLNTLTYEAYSTVGIHLLLLLFGLLVARATESVHMVIMVVFAVYVLNAIYARQILSRVFHIRSKVIFSWKQSKAMVIVVLPFALAAGFAKIYGAFDQIMLSKMAPSVFLGYYAVAYKLTFALQFIPMALVAVLYPIFSTTYTHNPQQTKILFQTALGVLLAISVPIVLITCYAAAPAIDLLYGIDFNLSVLPLQVLIISLPFLFINFPIGSLLNATDLQIAQTKNMGIALVINIILNAFLIPKYYATGAAMASTVSTLVLSILGLLSIQKKGLAGFSRLRKMLSGISLATLAMSVCLWVIGFYFDLYWPYVVGLSLIVYGLVIIQSKYFSYSYIRQILSKPSSL